MRISPEFQRNLWLELSPHRLIGMPALLAGVFFLMSLAGDGFFTKAVSNAAFVVYVLLVFIWGTRLASEAVVGEIKDRTWDTQRMSSVSAWDMAYGKLLGSTVYPWLGGLICLAVYSLAYPGGDPSEPFMTVSLLLLGGLLAQATALLASLAQVRRKASQSRSASAAYLVFGLIVAAPFIKLGYSGLESVQWYGELYPRFHFALASLAVFLAWAIVGIYRSMRAELQVANTPLVWIAFVIFVAVYVAGFVEIPDNIRTELTATRLFVAYTAIIALAYAAVFSEPKDPVDFRRLLLQLDRGDWRRVFHYVPAWMATVVLAGVAGFALLFYDYPVLDVFIHEGFNFRAFVVAAFGFLLRDVGLVVYFNLGPSRRRADAAAVLYLLVLYWLIPAILAVAHLGMFKAAFLPFTLKYSVVSMVSGLGQGMLMGWLVAWRWRSGQSRTQVRSLRKL